MDNDVTPSTHAESRHHARLPLTALTSLALGAIIAVGAVVQGAAVIGDAIWVPSFTINLDNAPSAMLGGDMSMQPADPNEATTSSAEALLVGQIILWTLISLLLAGLLFLVWKRVRRIQRKRIVAIEAMSADEYQSFGEEPDEPDEETMKRGLDYALDVLESDREPNDAVEEAWIGLQDAAEMSGVRRLAAETPSEFTRRMLRRLGADEHSVMTLLNLYLNVRFGGQSVSRSDVAAARDALAVLDDNWGRPAPVPVSAGAHGTASSAGRAPDPLAGGRAPNPLAGGNHRVEDDT